ncbi:MAG: helix-turn-helix domain-containing protein [Rudaea sp.]
MPNIGALLKTEISRLCRREVRREVAGVKKVSAAYRHDIAALKRQVATLQRKSALLEKRTKIPIDSQSPTLPNRPVRFVAKGLRSLRARLGLSASQLAVLLGVSEQSVYNWETKKTTPRKEQVAEIIGIRGIGKREAQQRFDVANALRGGKRGKRKK